MPKECKTLVDVVRYMVLMIIVAGACAFMPIGEGLWFEDLIIGGDVTTGTFLDRWDRSSLQVDDQGISCDSAPLLWAAVTNVGDQDMTDSTTAGLWYTERGGRRRGALVEGVEIMIPPLPAGGSAAVVAAPPVDAEGNPLYGKFWFVVNQRTGHPSSMQVWSDEILFEYGSCPDLMSIRADEVPVEVAPIAPPPPILDDTPVVTTEPRFAP